MPEFLRPLGMPPVAEPIAPPDASAVLTISAGFGIVALVGKLGLSGAPVSTVVLR